VEPVNDDALGKPAEYGRIRLDDPFDVQSVNVAFQRLQTKAMQDAAAAQVDAALAAARAARAAEDTARYTKDTARWMMWSVIVLAVSSILTLIATLLLRH
jgi:hypothetical protein